MTQSLFELLCLKYPESSRSTLRSWIERGRVELDGRVVKIAQTPVKTGQELRISPRYKVINEELKIVYEDRDLVVVDKPEGLLSVATDFDKTRSAHSLLKRRFHRPRIYPVHRLDRETSGLLVFAYTEAARDGLKAQFEVHSIKRQYKAIVHGIMSEKEGTLSNYLYEDNRYFVRTTTPERGKLAITHFKVLTKRSHTTVLELTLETGRKNQVRVQLAEAGFPIVGDCKYGNEADEAPRLYLHAMTLEFVHPLSKKVLSFHSACPF